MHLPSHCSTTLQIWTGCNFEEHNSTDTLVSNRLVNVSLEEHWETNVVPAMVDVKVPRDPLSVSCGLTTGALVSGVW